MQQQGAKTLILGMGNEILTDDGIGIKITKELQKVLNIPNLFFDTLSLGGMEIIEYIRDFDNVIIIDAIKTLNGVPGSVYIFAPSDFKETTHISNVHDVSFITALKLARELDIKVPDSIQIIAIEIVEDMTFSDNFTKPVQEKYPEILREVEELVISFLRKYAIL